MTLFRLNLLVENRLNGELYWPNVFHYGFTIQSLTWTLHFGSQNLQLASMCYILKKFDEFGFSMNEGKTFKAIKVFYFSFGRTYDDL